MAKDAKRVRKRSKLVRVGPKRSWLIESDTERVAKLELPEGVTAKLKR